jgi:formylglycine-generating enzyme required for sulfatase activity
MSDGAQRFSADDLRRVARKLGEGDRHIDGVRNGRGRGRMWITTAFALCAVVLLVGYFAFPRFFLRELPTSGFLKAQVLSGSTSPEGDLAILGSSRDIHGESKMKQSTLKFNSQLTSIAASAVLALSAISLSPAITPAAAQSCSGDNNNDGIVDGIDLATVLGAWGSCPGVVTSVIPGHGSNLGGTQITINGTNLSGTTAVKIGGVACTSLQVLSPTVVKAVTPAGTIGDAPISIVSSNATSLAPTPFTYVLQSITSVSPNNGIYSGGTAITITGTFLSGATIVKVGGVPATNVIAVDSNTVTAVTPAGSVGAASVEVTGAKGTATATNAFLYIAIVVPTWATLLEAFPDPAVVTDANLRAAIMASGFAWRVRDNAANIEMLLVPGGTFMMGCSPGDAECSGDESPLHQVTLTNAFYMGKTEVTQAQWTAVMGSNPSYFQGQTDSPSRPVERLSWNMVQPFCTQTGLRLPTEAEWEYACRAGTTTERYGVLNDIAWYSQNWTTYGTQPVAGKLPNALGLYDTLGNVWEWCQDWFGAYSLGSVTNPTGPATGTYRTLRDGDWNSPSKYCRASQRVGNYDPNALTFSLGFRVVRNP